MQAADIVYLLISSALVLLMTPGLAYFYGGLVNKKNIVSTTMHSYAIMALVSIQWILFGYSLAFGPDHAGIIGGLDWVGLNGVGLDPNTDYAATIPHSLFMIFQLKFAILTPALITGGFAERMKFGPFVAFSLLWSTLVYDVLAHWVWGVGGWLKVLGALDFAGGNVVHISSGVAALVTAIVLGRRASDKIGGPSNVPMTVLGGGLLWYGWFGFNAGSALGVAGDSGQVAINAFLTTNTAAAAGAIGWAMIDWIISKKPKLTGVITGAVVGLVAITPGAGYVSPMYSILIGFVGSIISFYSVFYMKKKLGYDDALDAFGCHGIGGIWGGIATGLFASKTINPAGADGAVYGNLHLLWSQIAAAVSSIMFTAVATFLILKFISLFGKLRTSEEEEEIGLDEALHGEKAYEDGYI